VCPVRINVHELLLENRRESVNSGESDFTERFAWKLWKQASLNRRLLNQGNAAIKNWVVNKMLKGWSTQRAPIVFPKKTFNELWKESQRRK
jgi:L-lactate dehydrogenase complex protein LldF